MNKLYSELAEVYEAMYATFINYKEEYNFYQKILSSYNKKSILEIGSGTGNLATHFEQNGFNYCGLDLSKEMIAIAKTKAPNCNFIEGDMRAFEFEKPVESILITARSISYLLSNKDVTATFKCVYNSLEKEGIFCFDFIDANRFIPAILKENKVTHQAKNNNINYQRKSKWHLNLEYGMDVIWESTYSKQVEDTITTIGNDKAVVRSFTKNELEILLQINNFKILEIMDRANYYFPTFVMVAQKI